MRFKSLIALAFLSGSVSAMVPVDQHIKPTGKGWGIAAPRPNYFGPPTAAGHGITYHGGKVISGQTKIYYIWYGNWVGNTASSILDDFAHNIGGSAYANILTTYNTSAQVISNQISFGGETTDNYSGGTVLNDVSVYNVIANALKSGRLPTDTNGIYFVLSSQDVSESSGFCSSYCAFHTSSGMGLSNIRYAFIGNTARCPSTCGVQSVSPNGNPGADAMANNIAHELAESITDPDSTAWYDAAGKEVGDKCSWNYVQTSAMTSGAAWNVQLGSRKYLLQGLWINVAGPKSTGYCGLAY